jgi:hypothetical protein
LPPAPSTGFVIPQQPRRRSMISKNLEKLLQEIYADTQVSPQEIIELRNAADEVASKVLEQEGHEGVVDALCKSFDVTTQLVQEVTLRLKRGDYTDTGRALVGALLEAHVALLRATLKAFG